MTGSIRFLGATDTVTGSRYLVEADGARVLVDCGLFQGYKKLRLRNWSRLPVEPASVDAVVLTHAHIDHSGYLPRLCKMGFAGKVYCTPGTRDLLEVLLPDAGFLQEEDARRANEQGYSRHHPAQPLYTRADAERCLRQLVPVPYYASFEPARGVSARYTRAGHILGSACLALRLGDTSINFTGDVGRPSDPIMKPPDPFEPCDFLVTEATYGDRRHPAEDVPSALGQIVREAVERGGVVLVPSFAVGRAQHLLYVLAELKAAKRIPDLPVFLDSPMAISATKIFCAHDEDHRLSAAQCELLSESARYARTPADSRAIDERNGPMIVISASGMATGGRVLHHLKRFVSDEKNVVLFVGYQAAGTRGRALLERADELKIHGRYVPVRARVVHLEGLSAHADYREMLDWLATSKLSPKRVFVTHGEPAATDAFRRRLADAFGWHAIVPDDDARWELASTSA